MGMREGSSVEKTVCDGHSYFNRLLPVSPKAEVPKVGAWASSITVTQELVEMQILMPTPDLLIPEL